MIYVWATIITALAWALRYYYDGPAWQEEKFCRSKGGEFMRGHLPVVRWTPDSDRYIAQGNGQAQCWPFHARFLIGWVCKGRVGWWHAVTAGSLIPTGPALCWYAQVSGLTPTQSLAVVIAFTGCWGAFGLLTLCPVLVDAPAMLLGLFFAAYSLQAGSPMVSAASLVGGGLLLGAIKETGPLWLACFAWHPAALVGLVVPAWRRWAVHHPLAHEDIIKHPILSAMQYRRGTVMDGRIMAFPWGIGLLALLNPSPQLWTALGLAYLQPLVASDVTRLVQQVAPVVLVAAIPMIPEAWLPLALVFHVLNPWQKTPMETQPVRLQGV